MSTPKFFADAKAFRRWLQAHAATAPELIVGFHKLDSGRPSMGWSDAVDEALCVGWIDGVRKRIDDASYLIRFTPRRPTSIWSAVNIAKFERLQALGRMRPAGVSAFARRKAEKTVVYAYEQAIAAELSAQELVEFKAQAAAWASFERTPPGYRKQVLHWVTSAKRAQTRASRLASLVQACAEGRRLR